MKRSNLIAGLAAVLLTSAVVAYAQEGTERSQEITVQGTGSFTRDSTSNGINQHADDTAGVLVNYRYYFNRWLGAEASYGWTRDTLQSTNSFGLHDLQTNVHQASGAMVVKLPWTTARLQPYVLGGAAALFFDPTGKAGNFVPGAKEQTKPAFLYGGGADYCLTRHISARLEYRGFVYERADFGLNSLHSGATTHTAQPSAGIGIRF